MTNHAVEYFHTLVEHKFEKDQYEVFYMEGKYHVTITIPSKKYSPISYFMYATYKKRMEKCLHGLIKPENLKLDIIIPPDVVKKNNERYRERIDKIYKTQRSFRNEQ